MTFFAPYFIFHYQLSDIYYTSFIQFQQKTMGNVFNPLGTHTNFKNKISFTSFYAYTHSIYSSNKLVFRLLINTLKVSIKSKLLEVFLYLLLDKPSLNIKFTMLIRNHQASQSARAAFKSTYLLRTSAFE